jgi:hypothetical protein
MALPAMYVPQYDPSSASTASTTTMLSALGGNVSGVLGVVSSLPPTPGDVGDSPASLVSSSTSVSDVTPSLSSRIARMSLHESELSTQSTASTSPAAQQHQQRQQSPEPRLAVSNSPQPSPRSLDDVAGAAPAASVPPIELLLAAGDEILSNFSPHSLPTVKVEPEDGDVEAWLKDAWLTTESIDSTHPSIQ